MELFMGMFSIVFFLAFAVILINMARGVKEWNNNNHSPRLTVNAKVVAKRTNHTRHSGGRNHMAHTTTTYFVTFEVESGDRMELRLQGYEYGLIVEGDYGELTFQGTRFLGFARKISAQ